MPVMDYFLPAEWHTHKLTLMGFPPAKTWWGAGVTVIRDECVSVANTLSEFEPVRMLVCPEDEGAARRLLSKDIAIDLVPIDDIWLRDTGPLTLIDGHGGRKFVNFRFDGWGGKCPHKNDKQVKQYLSRGLRIESDNVDFVLEGGAICVDGEGTLITTEQCLLNKARNSNVGKVTAEAVLKRGLGVDKVIWLSNGLVPDEYTDGHVDGICRFVAPGKVVLHTTDNKNSDNYPICNDAKNRLSSEYDNAGRSLEIIEIPLSGEVSHVNFYIANNCVLVPVSGNYFEDDVPMGILREMFSSRKVIGIKSTKLAEGGGGIHCITMQVPAP